MRADYTEGKGVFFYVLDIVCVAIGVVGIVVCGVGLVRGGLNRSNIILAVGVFLFSVAAFVDYLPLFFDFFARKDGGENRSLSTFFSELKVLLLIGVGVLVSSIWLWELLYPLLLNSISN